VTDKEVRTQMGDKRRENSSEIQILILEIIRSQIFPNVLSNNGKEVVKRENIDRIKTRETRERWPQLTIS
jgi:hypothetical protein